MTAAAEDWRDVLHDYLIKAGTSGRKQSEIVVRFQGKVDGASIRSELEALHLADKVQKFEIPTPARGGRSATVWRATTKLVEHD